ncbi:MULTISPECIES: hypothetical protein [Mycobacterium avium complex (MAC)]|uniref:Uncharacterized protein n=2 Tax=Mycobacterium TaxID=1763 RepID=A0A1X1XYA4_9MYCO|nr:MULTISPECIES: hypothetical protein [Mycobacterium avium complex (MAC)]ORW03734.1 hypothetical protein AWC14_00400 [Mycobacterium kyorinense]MBZ4631676.1 hypothetical protein [Mycobacterium avium subsp. hominissuis]MCV6991852.1 hypothetical protein [Mycobacterium bouchedurhonense]MCV6993673.1 hypothetical protein [Mycobacterium timonense]QWY65163.1 hypothetical protein BJP78_25900 [Mycobacterium avium subsp. hominissuis]
MPSITDILWCAVMVALMALVVVFAFWYFRRIRDGRINPIVAPDWTSLERPASPPSGLQWGGGEQRELDDDSHIGRPAFPASGVKGAEAAQCISGFNGFGALRQHQPWDSRANEDCTSDHQNPQALRRHLAVCCQRH